MRYGGDLVFIVFTVLSVLTSSQNSAGLSLAGQWPKKIGPAVLRLKLSIIPAVHLVSSSHRNDIRQGFSRQRSRFFITGFWQGVPRRVLARQRWPGHWGPSRVPRPASMNFLRFTNINFFVSPCLGLNVRSSLMVTAWVG